MRSTSQSQAALLIVDVQNDFCHLDGVFARAGRDLAAVGQMLPRLCATVAAWRAESRPVFLVRTAHTADTDSAVWLKRGETSQPLPCRAGTWGAELCGIEAATSDVVVVKSRYSAFHQTDLEELLRAQEVQEVLVAGVLTNVCVETTIREGCLRDFRMVLVEDCCATYDEGMHEATVENVRRYFGTVQSSGRLLAGR